MNHAKPHSVPWPHPHSLGRYHGERVGLPAGVQPGPAGAGGRGPVLSAAAPEPARSPSGSPAPGHARDAPVADGPSRSDDRHSPPAHGEGTRSSAVSYAAGQGRTAVLRHGMRARERRTTAPIGGARFPGCPGQKAQRHPESSASCGPNASRWPGQWLQIAPNRNSPSGSGRFHCAARSSWRSPGARSARSD